MSTSEIKIELFRFIDNLNVKLNKTITNTYERKSTRNN